MSVSSLCTTTCDIYESLPINNNLGSYIIQSAIKHNDIPCRITQLKSEENTTNGLEKENPSQYRIYLPLQLNVLTTDYIISDGVTYDILYVDKCYKYHMQILVKRNTNQNLEVNRYLIADNFGLNEIFITQDNGGLIIVEE